MNSSSSPPKPLDVALGHYQTALDKIQGASHFCTLAFFRGAEILGLSFQ
ncbi:hypothetical protein [Aphanothece sacrum]|nr:hypothetical protein [Aphanothece sacrum]